jgi:hypothetical protein
MTDPIRVNAGGPEYTDGNSNVCAASTGFDGGESFDVGSVAIANTTEDTLYQTEWTRGTGPPPVGVPFTFTAKVPNGTYNVTLKFAETWFGPGGGGGGSV